MENLGFDSGQFTLEQADAAVRGVILTGAAQGRRAGIQAPAVGPGSAPHRLRAAANNSNSGRLQRNELIGELIRAVKVP